MQFFQYGFQLVAGTVEVFFHQDSVNKVAILFFNEGSWTNHFLLLIVLQIKRVRQATQDDSQRYAELEFFGAAVSNSCVAQWHTV